MTPAARDRLRIGLPLLAASGAAWIALAVAPHQVAWSRVCSAASVLPTPAVGVSLDPARDLFGAWTLMIAAMMLPLVAAPVQVVHDRSLARLRWRRVGLFLAAYVASWTAAGYAILAAALALAGFLGTGSAWLVATGIALVWQASPAKQRALNRCHFEAPIAAFGWQGDRDALRFGLTHGLWCIGSCWSSMLVLVLLPAGHLVAMAACSLWIFLERLDRPTPPAWALRWPSRGWRILVARVVPSQVAGVPR